MNKKRSLQKPLLGLAALLVASTAPVHANIIISEVAPYASGNTVYAADWFELTNTGSSAQDITGWKMDDSSNSFASAVALRGVTSIATGQSIIFLEGNAPAPPIPQSTRASRAPGSAQIFPRDWSSATMAVQASA
jgi:hypothetical protein